MEKTQGFFNALKEEVAKGMSPFRPRSTSPGRSIMRRNKSNSDAFLRSGSCRPMGETLTPVIEGPDPEGMEIGASKRYGSGIGGWVRGQLTRNSSVAVGESKEAKDDLRLLLGVMGAPLAPVHVSYTEPLPQLNLTDIPIETSTAKYILQQFIAASGGQQVQSSIKNACVMGKLRMVAAEFENATKVLKNRNAARATETGGFVLWQMNPGMWYVELAVGASKVHAGCNGKVVWRHTPWLGGHTAKGPVRPLRRALQGLDPKTTASMFTDAVCIGEKRINEDDCFVLKVAADPESLKARSEGPAEIIRHVLFGYFSQRTGLLIHMEDSHLTRIQTSGDEAVYWETTINSFLDDYHPVDGIMIAHSGHSVVNLFQFGEVAMSHSRTRMEEAWTIDEVAFNVPGLSTECFIPPADLRTGPVSETSELPREETEKPVTTKVVS